MSRLGRNITANLAANGWSTVLSLLLTPVYVSRLGIESYALIGLYTAWVGVLGILDTGISATAAQELAWMSARADERRHMPSLLRTLEIAYWLLIVLVGVVLLLAAWWLGTAWFRAEAISPRALRQALMLMVASLVMQVPAGLYVGGLIGLQRQVASSALVAAFGTLRGVGAVVVLLIVPDIRAFFLWQIAAGAVQTGVTRVFLLQHVDADGHPARFSAPMLRSVSRFAGSVGAVTAMGLLLTQIDKVVLSRLVPLETLGFYMLAWTVASGLSRVTAPLLSAFGPHFTELVATGSTAALASRLRLASQLTNALVLPPAALLVLLAYPVLLAWIGNPVVAAGAAPLLRVITVGTLLAACAYPALGVVYSTRRLRPVIAVNLAAVVVLLPMIVAAVARYGALGASFCWALYGLTLYICYHAIGRRGLPGCSLLAATARDFLLPALASVAVAAVMLQLSRQLDGRAAVAAIVAIGLLGGWVAAALVCGDVRAIAIAAVRRHTFPVSGPA